MSSRRSRLFRWKRRSTTSTSSGRTTSSPTASSRTTRSIAGAARTRRCCSSSSRTSPTRASCCWSRTTARRRSCSMRRTASSATTAGARTRSSGPSARAARRSSLHEAYNEEEEGSYIVNEVRRLVGRGEARLSECAVMYRTNAQSRALEEQFIRSGTPYVVVGSKKFYERKEIKDVLAYLRLIANPQDTVSLQRIINVPTRKIGEKTFGEFLRWAQQEGMQPFEALSRIEEHPTLATAKQTRARPASSNLLADLRQKAHGAATAGAARSSAGAQRLRAGAARWHRGGRGALEQRARAAARGRGLLRDRAGDGAGALPGERGAGERGGHGADRRERHAGRGRAQEGRGDAHHAARGEGAGVPGRLPRRDGGGHPAALALAGEPA